MKDKLFNLPDLTELCCKKYGCSRNEVDNAVRWLFKKELISYPRTECCYITAEEAEKLRKAGADVPDSCIDESAVSKCGHTAIIPTLRKPRFASLCRLEANIFSEICKRTLGYELLSEKPEPEEDIMEKVMTKLINEDPEGFLLALKRSV